MAISKSVETFAVENNVTIDFFRDRYGRNVRVRYTDADKLEYGTVRTIGLKGNFGKPMTIEECIEECLTTLSNAGT